jgi:hypothetical protein
VARAFLLGILLGVLVHHLAQWVAGRLLGVRVRWLLALPSDEGVRLGRHALVLFGGGMLGNAIAAVSLTFIGAYWGGVPSARYMVSETIEDRPAHGKLQPGDVIVAIDGVPLEVDPSRSSLAEAIDRSGDPAVITVDRGGRSIEVEVTPAVEDGHRRIGVRITPRTTEKDVGAGEAARFAVTNPFVRAWEFVAGFVESLLPEEDSSAPVGITRMVRTRVETPSWSAELIYMAVIQILLWGVYAPIDGARVYMSLAGRRRARKLSQLQDRQIY